MAILNTPITTDDHNLHKVFAQRLPVLLVFHNDDIDKPLTDTLDKEAKRNAGDLLVVRMKAGENPNTFRKYGEPPTPSLVTITDNRKVKSDAEAIRPADVRNHIKHLLKDKPLPTPKERVPAGAKRPVHVTDETFRKEVLKNKKPVLVDFWAAWCGPCHQIAPYVDQLALEFGKQIKVAKVDIDANKIVSRRYGIQSIPTMIVFEDGQPAARISGANPVALRKTVERFAK